MNIHKLVFICYTLGIFLFSAAWSTHEDDSLRPAWSFGVFELKHTVHNLLRDILQRIVGINVGNRAFVDVFDTLDV